MTADFASLAQQCSPGVALQTMQALVRTESSFNPYAIGVVGGQLQRQPRNLAEAVATVKALDAAGYNFSMGYSQVNKSNLKKYGLDFVTVFEACRNLHAGSKILSECYRQALKQYGNAGMAYKAAFSCYYSGNFTRGFIPDRKGEPSYVAKVLSNHLPVGTAQAIGVIPNHIRPIKPRAVPAQKKVVSSQPRGNPQDAENAPSESPSKTKQPAWDVFGDFNS